MSEGSKLREDKGSDLALLWEVTSMDCLSTPDDVSEFSHWSKKELNWNKTRQHLFFTGSWCSRAWNNQWESPWFVSVPLVSLRWGAMSFTCLNAQYEKWASSSWAGFMQRKLCWSCSAWGELEDWREVAWQGGLSRSAFWQLLQEKENKLQSVGEGYSPFSPVLLAVWVVALCAQVGRGEMEIGACQ